MPKIFFFFYIILVITYPLFISVEIDRKEISKKKGNKIELINFLCLFGRKKNCVGPTTTHFISFYFFYFLKTNKYLFNILFLCYVLEFFYKFYGLESIVIFCFVKNKPIL